MDVTRKQCIGVLRNVGDHIEYNEECGGIYYTSDFVRMIEYVLELLEEPERITNAGRIRAMSNEELEVFINKGSVCERCAFLGKCVNPYSPEQCHDGVLQWLRQPVQPTPDAPDTHEHSGLLEE